MLRAWYRKPLYSGPCRRLGTGRHGLSEPVGAAGPTSRGPTSDVARSVRTRPDCVRRGPTPGSPSGRGGVDGVRGRRPDARGAVRRPVERGTPWRCAAACGRAAHLRAALPHRSRPHRGDRRAGRLGPACPGIGTSSRPTWPGTHVELTLAVAEAGTAWRPFATLTLGGAVLGTGDGQDNHPAGQDPAADVSFEPVLNRLPGLELPEPLATIRSRATQVPAPAGRRPGEPAPPPDPVLTASDGRSATMAAVPVLRPFTALRPLPQLASRVAAPPYDVVDEEQARAAMLAAPDSFLRVTRPDADPWLEEAPVPGEEHEHGRDALNEPVRRGVLVREEGPALWIYRQQVPRSPQGARTQTGIVGLAGVDDYTAGVDQGARAHPARQGTGTGRPRRCARRPRRAGLPVPPRQPRRRRGGGRGDRTRAPTSRSPPRTGSGTPCGGSPPAPTPTSRRTSTAAFAELEALYVADGHHRTAAAVRLHAARAGLPTDEAGETDGFLAVVFPAAELTVLPYHRLVLDLRGMSPEELLERLRERFEVEAADSPVQPSQPSEFGLRTGLGWHRVRLRDRAAVAGGVQGLAVACCRISCWRRCSASRTRGAIRGWPSSEGRTGSPSWTPPWRRGAAAAAFALAPTPLDDLVAVSDAGEVMPRSRRGSGRSRRAACSCTRCTDTPRRGPEWPDDHRR